MLAQLGAAPSESEIALTGTDGCRYVEAPFWTFNKFEEVYLLTRGGPGTSTFNLAVYAFEQATANLKLGVAAATGVIMLAFLFAGSVFYLRLMRQQEA